MDAQKEFRLSRKMNFDFMRLPSGRINLALAMEMVEHEELVRRLMEEEWAYLFKHALTQDAAYSTLMKQERRRLHQLVAETMEQVYAHRLDEYAARLAQHYAEAGDAQKSFHYAVKAGNEAARHSANAEALANYDAALDALSQLPDTPQNQRDRVDTLLERISISLRSEGPHRSLERLREAESLAQNLTTLTYTAQDHFRLARVRYWSAQAHLHGGATGQAIRYMQQVLTLPDETAEEQELRAMASSIIGRGLALQGRFGEAQSYLRVGAARLDKFATNHEWLLSVGSLGVCSAAGGDIATGVAHGQRALDGALQVNTLTGIALAHLWLSLIYHMGGDPVRGAAECDSILDIAEEAGDRLLIYAAHGLLATAQSRLGNHQAAFENLEKSERIAKQLGGRLVFHEWFAASAAEVALNAGLLDSALQRAEQGLEVAREAGSIYAEGIVQRVWGQALGASGSPEQQGLDQHFVASLDAFDAGDARLEAARTHVAWARILRERGNVTGAREHLEKAAAQFRVSGLERELAGTRELMHR